MLPIGACIASYHLFCCMLQTDLSEELPLRSQYQCCFHNCAHYMSLYIKSRLYQWSSGICCKCEPFILFSAQRIQACRYEHGKSCKQMSVLKIIIFNYLKGGFLMKLNDVCLFVSTIYHSEYITSLECKGKFSIERICQLD